MRTLSTSLIVVCLLMSSFVSQAGAQAIPPHVKDAITKLVGEWTCETEIDGKKSPWEFFCQLSPDETSVTYYWSGTDIHTGKKNSGSGILGWDATKQLVVELEIDADGTTFSSTHHILENGEWRSPTVGSTMIDGKPVHLESLRFFTFTGDGEWHGRDTNRMLGGKPQPDSVSVCKRKE